MEMLLIAILKHFALLLSESETPTYIYINGEEPKDYNTL